MSFFKYSFLNSLRDELGLTMTRQRATAFLFLYLAIPATGLGLGIVWGTQSHSPFKIIIGGATGLVIGGVVAWLLPRLLWNMLRLFTRKGWFLQTAHSESVPVMTCDEFVSRSKSLRQVGKRRFLLWMLLFTAGNIGFFFLLSYMDHIKPIGPVHMLVVSLYAVYFAGYVVLSRKAWNQLVRKLGLQCPACNREITAAAGLSGVPYMGLCRHCGTKVIEI